MDDMTLYLDFNPSTDHSYNSSGPNVDNAKKIMTECTKY